MSEIKEYVDITPYTTFQIRSQARYFTVLENKNDISELFTQAQKLNTKIYLLGGGSNTIFGTDIFDRLVVLMKIRGFEIISEDSQSITIKIGAGEDWDEIVEKTVSMGLSGLEALSAIPGSVGATPVQNVGAYGQEVKDTIISVDAFDIKTNAFVALSNTDCGFSYRESVFKGSEKGRYVITAVTFTLLKLPATVPNYPGVQEYFDAHGISSPTLLDVRNAIIEIRRTKLPDPKIIPNCGSFFKNPIVEKALAEKIKSEYPNVKTFDVGNDMIKIPAGWLIEQCGFKGTSIGPIGIYHKNALVLTNQGGATVNDIYTAIEKITSAVSQKFGIKLEAEPNIVR